MTITLIIIAFIIFMAIWYRVYFTNNSPSIMKNKYDNAIYSFDINNCYDMKIEWYENNVLKNEKTVSSKETISEITDLLKTLPKDGGEFISFKPSTQEKILFFCDENKVYTISFYNKKLKTPWTTFYSEKYENEEKIYSIVKGILASSD